MVRVPIARQEADRLLFAGRWHPVTESMTFFNAELDEVVAAFTAWRGGQQIRSTGCPLRVETVHGDLDELLRTLLPLQMADDRRFLFVPVATEGRYRTALFGDSWRGTETQFIQAGLAVNSGISAVEVRSCPNNVKRQVWGAAFHGIHELDLLWPDPEKVSGRDINGRLVGLRGGDSRQWMFVDEGDPLPFEDTSTYQAQRVRDRFSQQTLITYAAALGLRPFDEDFYAPDRTATLVSHTSPAYAGNRLISLEEAQGPTIDAVGVPDPDIDLPLGVFVPAR